jgi:ubiquinone/menaquinone biosynthesis C-methylase UbiE
MPSLSFDPVAHIYDATRGYPVEVAQSIAQAIETTAGATPATTFLEVGIGTGRIAFPLASLGHIYSGVDISEKMVEQLETKLGEHGWQEYQQPWGSMPDEDGAKFPVVRRFSNAQQQASMRLVIADMTALPFRGGSFDVVVAVHVFHLVDGWQQALHEVLRVLHPGGLFLHCWDEYVSSDVLPVENQWMHIVRELGGEIRRPGSTSRSEVTHWLDQQGLQSQESRVVRWNNAITPRLAVEYVTRRLWSSTWVVPDPLFAASVERLKEWANGYFGAAMDSPHVQERQFVICKTQV